MSRGRVAGWAAAIAMTAMLAACAAPAPGDAGVSMAMPPAMSAPVRGPTRPPAIQDLAGLKPDEILSILGKPDLKRDEPPAELWQYRAADCVLNLFFYDDAGGYRIEHAEAWQRTPSAGSMPARCRDENAPIKAHLITQSRL